MDDLASNLGKSHIWIRKQIDSVIVTADFKSISPRKIRLVCDATYFGKRKNRAELDGILVFLDSLTGQIVWFKFLKNETNRDFQECLNYLENRGFEILSVTTDGRRGLSKIFQNYPYQTCQFHIQKGVSILLTKSPKSEAGKELKEINKTFIKDRLTEQELSLKLAEFTHKHKNFLNEKSETDPTKFKHQRLIKALRKYKNNMKQMFTHQSNPIDFKNTTNDLDGGLFSPLKLLLNNHRGLSKERRKKLIIYYLNFRKFPKN